MTTNFSRLISRLWYFYFSGFILFAGSAKAQYDPDWASHVRMGALLGVNIKADFKLSGNLSLNHPAGTYDDGYVHPGKNPDFTTDWGYQNTGQYDSGANTLTFHQTRAFSLDSPSSSEQNVDPVPGFELAYGGNLWYAGRFRIGWDSGFGLLPISVSSSQTGSGSASQSVFTFNLPSGFVPPQPPYNGFPNGSGNPGSGYPSIPSKPGSIANISGTNGTISGTQTLDVMLYTLRIGPSVYWDFNQHLGMSVSAGPALGVVSGKLKYSETVTLDDGSAPTHSSGQVNGTDVVFGGYVNASLMYHVVPNGDFYIGAQYMPLGTATIGGGGREGQLKLGGAIYVSAGINWPF